MMRNRAVVTAVAIALVTVGVGVIVYVAVARDRLVPTPELPPYAQTPNVPLTPVPTPPEIVTAAGVVREYSPGALIIVMTPIEGQVEQVIVLSGVEVRRDDGGVARVSDIRPGQTLLVEGVLDPLDRLVAERITIALDVQVTPTATLQPSPTVKPTVTPTPTAMAVWEGEYFANPEIRGAPVLTRTDEAINFRWGTEAPAPGVPADNFSVRWTTRRVFDEGDYRFYARADDGVRVYVGGQLVLDAWQGKAGVLTRGDVHLAAGVHHVRVEYREGTGEAWVTVWWERPGQFPDWRGEYYPNPRLEGPPAAVRNDAEIAFDWGTGAPMPELPADGFSVRWSRILELSEGPYRFIVNADDGARIWVNDLLILDAWEVGAQSKEVGHIWLPAGLHEVRVEYVDRSGEAGVRLWWQRIEYFTSWRGEYYANPDLAWPPAFVRDDQAVDFDWGTGSPGPGVPADNFSVRWQRTVHLPRGRYRFWAEADDGVRVIVDGRIVIDEWHDSPAVRHTGETTLEEGLHGIIVEYYERTHNALVRFGRETVVLPSPTPTATLTYTPTPSPTATPTPALTESPVPTATATATEAPPSSTPGPTETEGPTETPTPTLVATAGASTRPGATP